MFDLNLSLVKLKKKKESIPKIPQHMIFLHFWDLKKCLVPFSGINTGMEQGKWVPVESYFQSFGVSR